MENNTETNPLEILVKQNETLIYVNSKLLNYYKKELKNFLNKSMDSALQVEQILINERKKIKNQMQSSIDQLSSVKLELSEEDRKVLNDSEQKIKQLMKISYYIGGLFILALIITLSSGYTAYKFYQISVLSKAEVRGDIIQEINASSDILVDENYHTALQNEKLILSQFIDKNERFKELYFTYRDGIVSNNKETPFLKNLSDVDVVNQNKE